MAAGDYLEVAVAAFKAVGIIENLDIVFVAFGMVDGVFVCQKRNLVMYAQKWR